MSWFGKGKKKTMNPVDYTRQSSKGGTSDRPKSGRMSESAVDRPGTVASIPGDDYGWLSTDFDNNTGKIYELLGLEETKEKYVKLVKSLLTFLDSRSYFRFIDVGNISDERLGILRNTLKDQKRFEDETFDATFGLFESLRTAIQEAQAEQKQRRRSTAAGSQVEGTGKMSLDYYLELGNTLDPRNNPILPTYSFSFELVQIEGGGYGHDSIVSSVDKIISFTKVEDGLHHKNFKYPAVVGSSGGGKTRAGFEAGKALKEKYGDKLISVFTTFSTDPHMSDNRDQFLADLIFASLTPLRTNQKVHYDMDDVQNALKSQGIEYVILQLDEYQRHPDKTREIVRACLASFQSFKANKFCVIPVLCGFQIGSLNSNFAIASQAKPEFITLPPLDSEKMLEALFGELLRHDNAEIQLDSDEVKELIRQRIDKQRGVRIITAAFGGVPRLHQYLCDVIKDHPVELKNMTEGRSITDTVCSDTLYTAVRVKFEDSYGVQNWRDVLMYPGTSSHDSWRRIHDDDFNKIMTRIHTFAVAGTYLDISTPLLPLSEVSQVVKDHTGNPPKGYVKSYSDILAAGLISAYPKSKGSSEVRIGLPIIALDIMAVRTNVCIPGEQLPLKYWWGHLEKVAMYSLRCMWNARCYLREDSSVPIEVGLQDLRPGGLMNKATEKMKFFIHGPLNSVNVLFDQVSSIQTLDHEFRTGTNGEGESMKIGPGGVFLLATNAEGNDGLVEGSSVRIWGQTKAIEVESTNSITPAEVGKLHTKQVVAGQELPLRDTKQVVLYDLFTNRLVKKQGLLSRLRKFIGDAGSNIPVGVVLTTSQNFKQVVGPVFCQLMPIYQNNSAEES